MGHYDTCYEYDQKYGREPHSTELQKANRKIKELEEKLSKAAEVRFTVNSVGKTFRLKISDAGILAIEEVHSQYLEDDGPYVIGITPAGKIARFNGVWTEGYQQNSENAVKIDKDIYY